MERDGTGGHGTDTAIGQSDERCQGNQLIGLQEQREEAQEPDNVCSWQTAAGYGKVRKYSIEILMDAQKIMVFAIYRGLIARSWY